MIRINYDDDLDKINWDAVFKCLKAYQDSYSDWLVGYREYMMESWGVDHENDYIRIINREKYLLFLLKWS